MHWSVWVIAGLLLVAAEMFITLEFWFLFLGVGALLTGMLAYLFSGLVLWHQLVLAAVLAVILLISFRPRLQRWLHKDGSDYQSDVLGDEVTISGTIAAGNEGRGELRGASWAVRNSTGRPLEAGERCRVSGREGLVLIITD